MGGMQNYVSHSSWILPYLLCLFTKYNDFLFACWFFAQNVLNFVSLLWKLDNPYYHISIPLMFHDLMIICGIFVPLLATKPIITSRVMPGLVSSKVQGIIPITYLALRAICCRVHYCIMHKDKVKRTNRLNLMVQAKSNQGSGLQSAICQWFFLLIWWSSTNNPAATLVESAWDIPYLNRKICLFHYQILL